jgi:hypothetical protein
MKYKVLIPLVVALTVGAGCSRSAEGQLPDPTMISQELLMITDMPGRWNETQRQIFDVRSNENPSLDPSVWCPEAEDAAQNLIELAGESGADVEMQAVTPSGKARLMRLQAWANDNVEAYFDAAKLATETCDGVTTTDDAGVKSTFEVIKNRAVGDESISWTQVVTPPEALKKEKRQSIGRTTIARFGSIIMVMQLGDVAFESDAVAMDEDDWWEIVELAGKPLKSLDSRVHK